MKNLKTEFDGKTKRRFNLLQVEPSFGFTLIEIMVSISIFTVVMMITIGALLVLNDGSRKAQALRTVIDNLNFAVEDMNRKVSTGDTYHCYSTQAELDQITGTVAGDFYKQPKDCSSGGMALSLKTQDDIWIIYRYGDGGITIRTYNLSSCGGFCQPLDITSREVRINNMSFTVRGSQSPYTIVPFSRQPMVILNVAGTVDLKKEKLRTDFSLQTAISHRGINE
ncbi:MAG: prepilin-type N-terminal cleavage/methylation domain-containing protein [Candidatus Vogelbacteria bacterium]|nr:prepilin-type N-terminal cleavage/methylation domain-containing protein [Candidatus Vogelbacteria bacterium]